MDLVHKCQLMLIELTMTAKSSTAVQEDEIDSLKKKVEKAANGHNRDYYNVAKLKNKESYE